jgi:hypothetical protein
MAHTKRINDELKLFALKHELLKISLRLQTAFVAEEEQLNMKSRMFRVGA